MGYDPVRRVVIGEKIEEEEDNEGPPVEAASKITHRSHSVPVFNLDLPKEDLIKSDHLDLSVDPLTGLWLDGKSSSLSDADRESSDFSDFQVLFIIWIFIMNI